ncbi:MAG: MATE family efflux transporter [Bacilli bacterium]|nr:MATE family efflux transporter [Bacilli bacterium]
MKKNEIKLSDHMTYKKLLRFTLPSILMMVFTSIYSIVDGFFISNFAGKSAFAAINLVFPAIMLVGGLGFMMGTGGEALVGKKLGEKREKEANEIFSSIIYFTIILGIVASILMFIFIPRIVEFLGATEDMKPHAILYARIMQFGNVFFMLQNLFQNFYMLAGKPKYAFLTSVASGICNIILDAVLVGVLKLGIAGAASATIFAQFMGALIPFIYFVRKNNTVLRIVRAKIIFKNIFKAMFNGLSELLSNVSMSVVGMVYNGQLLKYSGENGVAAYGVLMYVGFIFVAIYIGYAIGTAGFISYNYGAQNIEELKNIKAKSYQINIVFGVAMVLLAFLLSRPLSYIFTSYDEELLEITTKAMKIYAFSFLLTGCNIFTSSFFTALNNGIISAIISMSRTLVFEIGAVLILPLIFGLDGIWYAVFVSEAMSFIIGMLFLRIFKNKYQY